MTEVTLILNDLKDGDSEAANRLLPVVYEELRRMAAAKMAEENNGHTLQATALVHEAYLRLVGIQKGSSWDGRAHFFAAAAESMRRILVESARRKKQIKHGGNLERSPLEAVTLPEKSSPEDIVILDDALQQLGEKDPNAATLVKLRCFVGMTLEEAADALGVSSATAYRDWAYARAWLFRALVDDK